jgi:hypothetical protein
VLFIFILAAVVSVIPAEMGILMFVIGIIIYFTADKLLIRSDRFEQGDQGEREIEEKLTQLSDDYYVIADLLKNNGGNIDFTVVGPTGVFAIEVKKFSKNFKIDFDGKDLTFNGRKKFNDPRRQAVHGAMAIGNHLERVIGKKIFVDAVVVFANRTELHFGMNKIKNCYIIGKSWLPGLLMKDKKKISLEEIKRITEALIVL